MRNELKAPVLEPAKGFSLFDSDCLPWTRHLDLGWIYLLVCLSGNLLAVPLGLYLGLWIRTKRRGWSAFLIFLLIAGCILALGFEKSGRITIFTGTTLVILWLLGSFTLRYEVREIYREAEGEKLELSILYTALFSVWYLNYRLRPMRPGLE